MPSSLTADTSEGPRSPVGRHLSCAVALALSLLGTTQFASAQVTLAQPNDQRQLDNCATCASFTAAYSTPSFVLNGAPVITTLRYSSEYARPTGYIELDVKFAGPTKPTRISIRLKHGASYVTLTNDSTQAVIRGDTTNIRIAAQFDASALESGVHLRDVYVTAFYGDSSAPSSSLADSVKNVRLLVQREMNSPYGRGWVVAGDARLRTSSGDVLLTDGAGGLAFFKLVSCGGTPWTCAYTSPIGDHSTLLRRVKSGSDTVWTRTSRAGEISEWSNAGLLRSTTDRWGNTFAVERMTTGDVARIHRTKVSTVVGGTTIAKYTTFGYDGTSGKLASITLPDGRQSTFTVASGTNGELTAVSDPDGRTAFRAGYGSGRIDWFTGRGTDTTHVVYDAFGQVSRLIGPPMQIDSGTTVRDTTFITSQRRLLLESQAKKLGVIAPEPDLRDSTFLRVTNARGTTTTTWAHLSGAPAKVRTRTSGGTAEQRTVTYDSLYRIMSTAATNGTTEFTWDGPRLTSQKVLQPNLGFDDLTEYFYRTDFDQLDSVRVNGTKRAHYFYSGSALAPDSVRADSSVVTRFTYDAAGRVLTVTDRGTNRVVTTTYESTHGNPASVARTATGVTSATTSYTYDGSGRVLTVTDPANRVFATKYDSLNRVVRTIGPTSDTTRFITRDSTRTDTLFDAMGQRYVTVRNARGLVTRQEDPRGRSDYYWYDRLGRLVKQQNRRGDSVRVEYDDLGRMTRRRAWTVGGQLDTARFAYDATYGDWIVGANAESIDSIVSFPEGPLQWRSSVRGAHVLGYGYGYIDGTWTFTRFAQGDSIRPNGTWLTQWRDTSATAKTVYHRTRAITDYGGRDSEIGIDQFGRLVGKTLPTSTISSNKVKETVTLSWDDRPLTVAFSGQNIGTTQGRTYSNYDVLGRIGTVLRSAALNPRRYHTYDAGGRLASYEDVKDSLQQVGWDYVWDELHQEWDSIPAYDYLGTTVRSETYAYDKLANRTDHAASLDSANRLLAFDGWTITYDDAGYMTKRKKGTDSLVYAWNAIGQLIQVTAPGYTTTYGYDAFGSRVRKTVNGVSTRYLVEDGQIIVELDNAWQVAAKYTYYPGVDRPQAMVRAGKRYYFLQDAQGNVTAVIDSAGTIKNTYEYTPYGEALTGTSETVANPFRFKGREWDAEARLHFMRARYYDPVLGRFVSEDPLGLGDGTNPTAFVASEPVNRTDPSGKRCQLVYDMVTKSDDVVVYKNFRYIGTDCDADQTGGVRDFFAGVLGMRFTESTRFAQLAYGDLSASFVLPGECVKRGERIATSGSSGSGQPHLHVQGAFITDITVGPYPYRPRRFDPNNLILAGVAASPLDQLTISSPYLATRNSAPPGWRYPDDPGRGHGGIDYSTGGEEVAVYAMLSGCVMSSDRRRGLGLAITINSALNP